MRRAPAGMHHNLPDKVLGIRPQPARQVFFARTGTSYRNQPEKAAFSLTLFPGPTSLYQFSKQLFAGLIGPHRRLLKGPN